MGRGGVVRWPTLSVVAALMLNGCAVGPNYVRPAAIVSLQYKELKGWRLSAPRDDFAKGEWWKLFDDPLLSTLEAQVAVSNQTIKADEANYREAQALIAEARSLLFPTLNFDPSLTRSSQLGATSTSLSALVSGSWMPDLWGKVRRQIESQAAGAQASAADLANATLSMQSLLASAYYQLRETDSLHDLLADTVAQYQHSLQITQNQYSAGVAAQSDVITAQALVLAAQAQEIGTGVVRAQYEHAIAVLMGRPPAGLTVPHGAMTHRVPHVPIGVPSTLLERRPDIAAAERTMAQENALIGVAFAGYYPSVTLTGAAGYLATPGFGPQNAAWSFGLSAAQLLFDGGLTAAQVEAARDAYLASVAAYRQTVLTAFQQVEDQLAGLPILGREAAVQVQAVKSAEQAVQIALNEYQAGTQTFTTVVTAEATALQDEEALLQTREQELLAAVSLIVALGGGWDETKLPPE
jgi:NodT family efflux transporter outer membrane factor (OMF) lipoprotein